MTKDEIQTALDQCPKDGNYTAEYLLEWFYHHQKTVFTALQSALDSPSIPDGYVLVPKEPTVEMKIVGRTTHWKAVEIYKGMISAAPQVKAETVDTIIRVIRINNTLWLEVGANKYIVTNDLETFGFTETKIYDITRKTK